MIERMFYREEEEEEEEMIVQHISCLQTGGKNGIGCVLWPSSVICSRLLLESSSSSSSFASNQSQGSRLSLLLSHSNNSKIKSNKKSNNSKSNSNNHCKKNKKLLIIDIGAGCGLTSIALYHRFCAPSLFRKRKTTSTSSSTTIDRKEEEEEEENDEASYYVLATDKQEVIDQVLQTNLQGYIQELYHQQQAYVASTSSPSSVTLNTCLDHLQIWTLNWIECQDSSLTVNLLQQAILNLFSKTDQHQESTSIRIDHLEIAFLVCSDCCYNSLANDALIQLLDTFFVLQCHWLVSRSTKEEEVEEGDEKQNAATPLLQVLIVNERRSAFDEFLYLVTQSRTLVGLDDYPHLSSSPWRVTIQEISLQEEDLMLIRNADELKIAPPIRACLLTWSFSS
jgi:hypothetical protein